jgi:hypothetical protein
MKQPDWATNEYHWRANCREIVDRSQDLLDGRLGVIQAARALRELAFRVRAEQDEDFMLFRVIDSESDALPTGAERAHPLPTHCAVARCPRTPHHASTRPALPPPPHPPQTLRPSRRWPAARTPARSHPAEGRRRASHCRAR